MHSLCREHAENISRTYKTSAGALHAAGIKVIKRSRLSHTHAHTHTSVVVVTEPGPRPLSGARQSTARPGGSLAAARCDVAPSVPQLTAPRGDETTAAPADIDAKHVAAGFHSLYSSTCYKDFGGRRILCRVASGGFCRLAAYPPGSCVPHSPIARDV